MRKTKCINGHFFDGEIINVCPVCNAPEMVGEQVEEKKGFFSWWGKNDTSKEVVRNENHTKGFNEMAESYGQQVPVESRNVAPQPVETQPVEPQTAASQLVALQLVTPQSVTLPLVPSQPVASQPVEQQVSYLGNSLSGELKSAKNTEDPKTVGVYSAVANEPVVGWLVCTKGESVGESFEIYAGQSSVGRSMGNDIILSKEASISREKHAYITFDPQNLDFYIQKGESSGLTYLEGKLVMSFEKMIAYNKLVMGTSEFVFVPLCGESFRWSDYL